MKEATQSDKSFDDPVDINDEIEVAFDKLNHALEVAYEKQEKIQIDGGQKTVFWKT